MYIKQIHITAFGKLSDRDYDFSEGLNIIEGKNESGKSTLLSFIKFMLYGVQNKPANGMSVPERRLVISWEHGRAAGSMTVFSKGRLYRIERELVMSSRTDSADNVRESFREHCAVISEEDGSTVYSGKYPGEEFFGVPEGIFISTAFVGQISGAYVNGTDISTSIENLLFSADESVNVDKAVSRLDEARRKLLHKSRKGGDIYDLECERSALRSRISDNRSNQNEILELEGSIAEYGEKLKKNAERSDELAKLSELNEAYNASKRFDILHAHERKIAEVKTQLEELNCGDKEADMLVNLRARSKDFSLTKNAYDSANAKLENTLGELSGTEPDAYVTEIYKMGGRDAAEEKFYRHNRRASSLTGIAVLTLIFAILSIGLGIAAYFVDQMISYAICLGGLLIAAISITCFIIRARHRSYIRSALSRVGGVRVADYSHCLDALFEIEKVKERKRTEIAEAKMSVEYARERHNDAAKALASALIELGLSTDYLSPEGISSLEEQLAAKIMKKAELDTELERHTYALETARNLLEQFDEAAVREKLRGADIEELSNVNLTALRREREFLISSSAALTEKLGEKQKRLAALSAVSGDPTEMNAKIAELDKKIEDLTLRHDAYTLAEEALLAAGESLRTGLSPKLNSCACEMLSKMTDGKYDRLGVDNELSLSCRIDGITRETDYLSSGTRDLTYISLRLALMDLLYRTEVPPMFFDETFARVDDDRLRYVLSLFDQLAGKGKQIFLFTCQIREAELAKGIPHNKISL